MKVYSKARTIDIFCNWPCDVGEKPHWTWLAKLTGLAYFGIGWNNYKSDYSKHTEAVESFGKVPDHICTNLNFWRIQLYWGKL